MCLQHNLCQGWKTCYLPGVKLYNCTSRKWFQTTQSSNYQLFCLWTQILTAVNFVHIPNFQLVYGLTVAQSTMLSSVRQFLSWFDIAHSWEWLPVSILSQRMTTLWTSGLLLSKNNVPVNCTYLKFGFKCFYNIPFLEYVPTYQFFSQNDKFSHPKAISMIFSRLHVHNIQHQPRKLLWFHYIIFSFVWLLS